MLKKTTSLEKVQKRRFYGYDNDGLSDILESSQYGTDPNDPDTDGDSLLDGWEGANG